jgi:hypothetical protein
MNSLTGKYLIAIGIILIAVGILIYFLHDKMGWLGNLPGDLKIERENFRFYFPLTTMIILSIVLTAILYLFRKIF